VALVTTFDPAVVETFVAVATGVTAALRSMFVRAVNRSVQPAHVEHRVGHRLIGLAT
jgi:hypothetical protein